MCKEEGQSAKVQGRMSRSRMIQETEMKQRSARMVGPFKSFQFIRPARGQEVPVQRLLLHKGSGGIL
ncbi:hypothetical protein EB061_04010 [bacterium]|nr:hypothetical protein [bacterium]